MTEPLNPLYYLNVGPGGTFRQSGDYQTTPAQVDALFDHLEKNSVDKVTVFFHGGLVSESDGMAAAKRLLPTFQTAGSHPVFFVWETGLKEILIQNITGVANTQLVQKLLKYVLQQVAKRWGIDLGGKGVGGALSMPEIEAELAKPEPFADFDNPEYNLGGAKGGAGPLDEATIDAEQPQLEVELEEDLTADPALEALVTDEAPTIPLLKEPLKEINPAGSKGGVEIVLVVAKVLVPVVIRTLKRRANKTDHGLYPTVMEELLREVCVADLGATVWNGMKNAAAAMWEPNAGPVTVDSHPGAYFLEKLAALKQKRPGLKVDLVGHSAGSIAICRMLAAAQRYAGLKMRNIVLLAPGCTMELLYAELVSKPERFEKFRMFTMHDKFESADALVPGLYTRSLIYFVSGVLEDESPKPLAGLERWLWAAAPDAKGNLAPIRVFMAGAEDRLVFSTTGEGALSGLRCLAISHGAFDNDETTLESVQYLIAN